MPWSYPSSSTPPRPAGPRGQLVLAVVALAMLAAIAVLISLALSAPSQHPASDPSSQGIVVPPGEISAAVRPRSREALVPAAQGR